MNKRTKRKITKFAINNPVVIVVLVLVALAVIAGLIIYQMFFAPDDSGKTYDIPEGTAEFHYIDVGQGDATLIFADGKTVLIDTGEADGDNVLIKYLQEKGVEIINYFIITHFDSDHFGEATEILSTFVVENLIIPDQVKTTKMYTTFIEAVAAKPDIYVSVVEDNDDIGDAIDFDDKIDLDTDDRYLYVGEIDPNTEGDKADLELEFLGPVNDTYSNSNDYSIIVMIRWGNNKLLFTGDAEEKAEEALVEKYPVNLATKLDCDVFKAGHHGSSTSSSQEVVDAASPEYVIISCGEDNKYGHPHIEAMNRFKAEVGEDKIYRTDTQGTIIIVTDGTSLTVSTEK